ncbi:hypothetical protein BJ138DRAFT_184077 [Hygrophoropsis aurantiaca]|uniref:Uncharacterized protein n=1 Tax=Hygrophoropsis aurantiaca TaxID=72124 RepID=A0ACB8A8W0_9AGAM|nr:hypothetical protein BJ138DRAFT_184077 [Hygrophoropsis aurantiaca]
MNESVLPSYTPSPPSPFYSTELLPGETTIVESRRARSEPRVGTFRRITDTITLLLRDQYPGSIEPSYGRNGLIRGQLTLRSSNDVAHISLKLAGQLTVQVSGSSRTTTIFSNHYTLWQEDSSKECCPPSIPFNIFFPPNFQDGEQKCDLPPSFSIQDNSATCSYALTVILSRQRKLLSLLKSYETLVVGLRYHPRSRPQTPMLPNDLHFMSTVKSSPEEWHQIVCAMNSVSSSDIIPIQCSVSSASSKSFDTYLFLQLFIPAIQVYALSDTIPFHLQIRAPLTSLLSFFGQSKYSKFSPDTTGTGGASIRVYLLRQTKVNLYEATMSTSRVLGEGKLKLSQPNCSLSQANNDFEILDWDGEVRCTENVTTASFATSQLVAKDFIVLALTPTKPQISPLVPLKHYHSVRLVTDPWTDQAFP